MATLSDALKNIFSLFFSREDGLRLVELRIIQDPKKIASFKDTWLKNGDEVIPSILKKEEGLFPIIEIKLLNSGEEVVFLKSLNFTVNLVDKGQSIC